MVDVSTISRSRTLVRLSAGRQSGNRVGHPAELADRPEAAALAHSPAAQLLRVGVDRV